VTFIDTPNEVTFLGDLDVIGPIVTEDAGDDALDQNRLHFSGNTSTHGAEALPDEAQFAGLKELPGTFLLAPGFSAQFTGNFGTINGTMAADEFGFTGDATGTVHGWVINWGDTEFTMGGNASLTIDHEGLDEKPFGFKMPSILSPLPETYEEF